MGVQYSPKQVPSVPFRLSATFRGTLGQAGRAGRLKILSWNSGAGNAGCLDEIDAYGVSENIDIICIQETRLQSESEWSTASYHYIHSGKAKTSGSVGGLLVMVSTKLVKANQLRFASIVRGHLLHVRIQMRDYSVDLLNFYQLS